LGSYPPSPRGMYYVNSLVTSWSPSDLNGVDALMCCIHWVRNPLVGSRRRGISMWTSLQDDHAFPSPFSSNPFPMRLASRARPSDLPFFVSNPVLLSLYLMFRTETLSARPPPCFWIPPPKLARPPYCLLCLKLPRVVSITAESPSLSSTPPRGTSPPSSLLILTEICNRHPPRRPDFHGGKSLLFAQTQTRCSWTQCLPPLSVWVAAGLRQLIADRGLSFGVSSPETFF